MDAFEGFELEKTIAQRAHAAGIELPARAVRGLAGHARRVLAENDELHLTTVVRPSDFVERHIGESLEGAALLDPATGGALVDLGSGNGYPGLVVATARAGLRASLVEASWKKAAFLRSLSQIEGLPAPAVLERQVQRADDLSDVAPLSVITARAVGGWERLLPRLARALADDGKLLLWAGETVETVARRAVWRRLRLVRRHPLPGRERSWVWLFEPAGQLRSNSKNSPPSSDPAISR